MDRVAVASKLTMQQQAAIDARDVNVALSAGAGCGKTFVLTERFLSHLNYDPDADATTQLGKLTAITFTERAAREMRERVRSKVRSRLLAAESDREERHWLNILRRLESARISTIHSFCGTLLRSHAVEAGLDPQFGVIEPTEAEVAVNDLIEDRFRELLVTGDDSMIDLTADYDLTLVRKIVSGLLKQRYRPGYSAWLEKSADDLLEAWRAFHAEFVPRCIWQKACGLVEISKLRDLFARTPPVHPVLVDRCRTILELVAASDAPSPVGEALDRIVEESRVVGANTKKVWAGSEELLETYKHLLEKLRNKIKDRKDDVAFDVAAARPAAEAVVKFLKISEPIGVAYDNYKREQALLDFDDLLVKARDLLRNNAEVCVRLSRELELLLVDECQDTDALQAELIDALCGGAAARGKLFFVGDIKQSIYRFRRADPAVFRAMRSKTPAKGRLPLTLNFRSQPAVLDFVNALFGDHFRSSDGEYHPLEACRPAATDGPAVEFLWASEAAAPNASHDNYGDTNDDAEAAETNADPNETKKADRLRKNEAEWIARRLRNCFDGDELQIPAASKTPAGEKPKTRRPGYDDVAILFRAMSNVADYEAALQRYGIPYYVVGGKAFYAQQELYDVLNLLRVIDSRCDDVALAGALRSPFFSLSDETLFLLTLPGRGLAGGFFGKVLPDELDGEQRRRVEFAARTINELRLVKDRLPIADLLNEILARTAYDAILLAEFLGERKLANLRKLIDFARDFDRSNTLTLTHYIEQLGRSIAHQPDEALAATYAEGANVVRLMSIHQAKGLEFPIVVVPDLERQPGKSDSSVAFHESLGPVVKSSDDKIPSGLNLFKIVEAGEDAQESIRLFYVVTTRARDYLILSAGVEDPASPPKQPWRRLLAERFNLLTGECVVDAADERMPRVRVTSVAPPAGKAERKPRSDWDKIVEDALKLATGERPAMPPGTESIAPRVASRRAFSFSRLNGALQPVDAGAMENALPETTGATDRGDPTAFGTLVHAVAATVDIAWAVNARPTDLEVHVARQARRLEIDDLQQRAAAVEMLARFFQTSRARDIASARRIYRELEFVLAWPPGKHAADGIYLQGFIDLLYQDAAGRWRLLDYKTHRVTAANVAAAAMPYTMQLAVYGLAFERILERPPDELVLSFLHSGVEHVVHWNDDLRHRAIEWVNRFLSESSNR